jgi:hypothetical protein
MKAILFLAEQVGKFSSRINLAENALPGEFESVRFVDATASNMPESRIGTAWKMFC